jgi:hypothetical protein
MRLSSLLTLVMASTAFAYLNQAPESKVQARAVTDEVRDLKNAMFPLLITGLGRGKQP